MNFEQLKKDLKALSNFEVILFGSYASSQATVRSDIDVAVVTRQSTRGENKRIQLEILGKVPEKYDVKVFELLPLPVQVSIIKNYKVIYGDLRVISEYFYYYRTLWKDVQGRYEANQFKNIAEKKIALAAGKAITATS